MPPSLEILNLGEYIDNTNKFTGGIPAEWGSLTSLKELKMVACGLDGALCRTSSTRKRSQNRSQSRNFPLTFPWRPGAIPPELGRLTNLKELILCGNFLSGTFADSLPICVCPVLHKKKPIAELK